MKRKKRTLDASQFGDTILSPVIKPMKKKKKLKTHNPHSMYQQWEFNDLTQPSQPIARYQEDSPPPSPPSLLSSPAEPIIEQCLVIHDKPVEQSSVTNNVPVSVEQCPDFIPAMITQPDTQESTVQDTVQTSDKICIKNIKPKNRTCRMDTNVPKLFSSKSADRKVIKTTKDIKILSQEASEKPRTFNKMFRRSNPQHIEKEAILQGVGLVHKKAPVSIISKAITKQLSGKRPKKKVRYEENEVKPKKVRSEEKKETPRRREYKAIPLQIVLTKQTIPQKQRHPAPPVIHPLKKLPPLRRKPIVTKSSSKVHSKGSKPTTLVSKLKQSKEIVYCADSDDEFKDLSGYEKRQAKLKVASVNYSSQLEFKKGDGVKAVPAVTACAHVSEEFSRVQFEVAILRKKWSRQTNEH